MVVIGRDRKFAVIRRIWCAVTSRSAPRPSPLPNALLSEIAGPAVLLFIRPDHSEHGIDIRTDAPILPMRTTAKDLVRRSAGQQVQGPAEECQHGLLLWHVAREPASNIGEPSRRFDSLEQLGCTPLTRRQFVLPGHHPILVACKLRENVHSPSPPLAALRATATGSGNTQPNDKARYRSEHLTLCCDAAWHEQCRIERWQIFVLILASIRLTERIFPNCVTRG